MVEFRYYNDDLRMSKRTKLACGTVLCASAVILVLNSAVILVLNSAVILVLNRK